jgi:aryl-alcohol dehydrogenase-like predicted oxidoreductase
MERRTLGHQGLTASAIGYGAMGISAFYGPGDERDGIAGIQHAHDLGVTVSRPGVLLRTRGW